MQFARILVVDDSPDVSLALATILEDAGHDIIEAEDGDQVFDLAISESPNVVLMDVMMPRVNGIDALATLKADTRTSSIPVSWSLLKVDLKTWRWPDHSVPLSTSPSLGQMVMLSFVSTGRWLLTKNRRAVSSSTESTLI